MRIRRIPVSGRIAVVSLAIFAGASAVAQSCNPAVDGTYCAENGVRRGPGASSSTASRQSLDFDWAFKSSSGETTGTLGAITFGSDGSRCVGLIRRVNCNGG
jgi:hypothetical protein